MMLLIAVLLAQAAPAAPSPVAQAEQRARASLAARGMSKAGIDTMIAIEKKHVATLRVIVQRGQMAEAGLRQALVKRPVDMEGFTRSNLARADAATALQREGVTMANEQMRALSAADRGVLATILTTRPQASNAPTPPVMTDK